MNRIEDKAINKKIDTILDTEMSNMEMRISEAVKVATGEELHFSFQHFVHFFNKNIDDWWTNGSGVTLIRRAMCRSHLMIQDENIRRASIASFDDEGEDDV